MYSFNKVILLGRLTRNPELRISSKGISICNFGIAISRKYRLQDKTEREEVSFIDINCFGKQAEIISKFFHKGNPILLEGYLKLEQWESQNGDKRSKLVVILETFQFIEKLSNIEKKEDIDDNMLSSDNNEENVPF